jgi:L-malate glycosyltransferase
VRIRHLLASPYFSGPSSLVLELALAQRTLGHEVSVSLDAMRNVVTSEELAAPHFAKAHLLVVPPVLRLCVRSGPLQILSDLRGIKQLAVDVLHCHFTHDHLLARWSRKGSQTLIRSIHAPRSLRASIPAADGLTVPYAALLSQIRGCPAIVLPPILSGDFVPPENKLKIRQQLQLPSPKKLVGMVSTFQKSRNHLIALEALVHLPEVTSVLIGDGAEMELVQARVTALGLGDRVRLTGYLSGIRFVEYLQALDEVWILGLGNDFAARAAAQAKACEVRVIAVDEGNLAHFADVVIPLEVHALVQASNSLTTRQVRLESAEAIAQAVLSFYERVGQ